MDQLRMGTMDHVGNPFSLPRIVYVNVGRQVSSILSKQLPHLSFVSLCVS